MSILENVVSASQLIRFTALTRAAHHREHTATNDLRDSSAASPVFSHAQAVLDAICNLRAIDDAYGIGDGYFGQPLRPLYRELPNLSAGEILETVVHLLNIGYLRGRRHNPSLVWVTNQGWLNGTSWHPRNQFLLRDNEPND